MTALLELVGLGQDLCPAAGTPPPWRGRDPACGGRGDPCDDRGRNPGSGGGERLREIQRRADDHALEAYGIGETDREPAATFYPRLFDENETAIDLGAVFRRAGVSIGDRGPDL